MKTWRPQFRKAKPKKASLLDRSFPIVLLIMLLLPPAAALSNDYIYSRLLRSFENERVRVKIESCIGLGRSWTVRDWKTLDGACVVNLDLDDKKVSNPEIYGGTDL